MGALLPVYALRRHRIQIDGDGVVTLVGVIGCPLKCEYCLNPEARDATAKYQWMSAGALYEALAVDDIYFQATGGGVTFGGGEPLMHAEFFREFIPRVKGTWQVRIETSLNVPRENIDVDADLFIVDIKDMHEDIYRRYTGASPSRAYENLKALIGRAGVERVLVRAPLIPGYNDEETRAESVNMLRAMGVTRVNAFAYRLPGGNKKGL